MAFDVIVIPLLLCLAGRCLFAEATVPRFSVPRYPARCSAHVPQVNCSMKVGGEPSIVTHLRTAFLTGHSSNVAAGAVRPMPLFEAEPCDDAVPTIWALGRSLSLSRSGVAGVWTYLLLRRCFAVIRSPRDASNWLGSRQVPAFGSGEGSEDAQ
jgi:hypothetical protein